MLHACPSGLRGLTQDQVLFQLVSSNLTACKKFLFYFLDIFNIMIIYSYLNDICFINAFFNLIRNKIIIMEVKNTDQ